MRADASVTTRLTFGISANGGVVEMVVVIVGDNPADRSPASAARSQVITGKALLMRERRGVIAKYRVDQDTFTRQLQIPR